MKPDYRKYDEVYRLGMYCIFVLIVIMHLWQQTLYSVRVNSINDKRLSSFNIAVMQGQFSK